MIMIKIMIVMIIGPKAFHYSKHCTGTQWLSNDDRELTWVQTPFPQNSFG